VENADVILATTEREEAVRTLLRELSLDDSQPFAEKVVDVFEQPSPSSDFSERLIVRRWVIRRQDLQVAKRILEIAGTSAVSQMSDPQNPLSYVPVAVSTLRQVHDLLSQGATVSDAELRILTALPVDPPGFSIAELSDRLTESESALKAHLSRLSALPDRRGGTLGAVIETEAGRWLRAV
jgi:hypothetical protein